MSLKENKFFKYLKITAKWTYKICYMASGVGITAFSASTLNVPAAIAGAVMIFNSLNAAIKDKNFGKLSPIINGITCNIGNASNDPKINK